MNAICTRSPFPHTITKSSPLEWALIQKIMQIYCWNWFATEFRQLNACKTRRIPSFMPYITMYALAKWSVIRVTCTVCKCKRTMNEMFKVVHLITLHSFAIRRIEVKYVCLVFHFGRVHRTPYSNAIIAKPNALMKKVDK